MYFGRRRHSRRRLGLVRKIVAKLQDCIISYRRNVPQLTYHVESTEDETAAGLAYCQQSSLRPAPSRALANDYDGQSWHRALDGLGTYVSLRLPLS